MESPPVAPTPSEPDLFRTIFYSAGLGIAVVDGEGQILQANPTLEQILGHEPSAWKGRSIFSFAAPEPGPEYAASFRSFRDGNFERFRLEGKFLGAAGDERWLRFNLTPLPRREGEPFTGVLLLANVTAMHAAQERLEESEQQFRTLVRNLPGAAFRCANDKDWTMFYISEGVETTTGYPAADFVQNSVRSFASVIHEADREHVDTTIQMALREDRAYTVEYRVVRRDNSVGYVHEKGRGVYKNGVLAWLDGFIMDVTEQVESKRLLEEQRAKMVAASKLTALGQMSAGIAHEVNNPLAIIHGEATLLAEASRLDSVPDRARLERAADRIAATALRISKIIKALRFFAREAKDDPLERADLGQILLETTEFCRERLRNHGVDLRLEIAPGPHAIDCRSVQISQVILNLLNNAFDAVEHAPEKWIAAKVSDGPDYVELAIVDSGTGIPPQIRGQIMMPFFTTKDVGRGTGLGLSVSSGIVESHRGRLFLDESSAATRFVLRLPRAILTH